LSSEINRRRLLGGALALGAASLGPALLAACGSGAQSGSGGSTANGGTAAPPVSTEKITIGFIPLTDSASVVMAHELGLYAKYGVNVELSKEASWANLRDKLVTGELQAAHCLLGMPFSVYTGVGGTAGTEMPIAMLLSNNGQGITLAKNFCGSVKYADGQEAGAAVDALKSKRTVTFAMTFPGGTHDMWLRYWLAASGIDQNGVKIIVVPPPQMVANMAVGDMDGFCVGEPWNGVAVKQGIGTTHIATQDIWKNHPEKALVLNKEFSQKRDEVKAVMKAVLEASAWLDIPDNRRKAAATIGGPSYVSAPADVIDDRLSGNYDLGCGYGEKTYTDDSMLFSRGGLTNFPRKSYAVWFMTQYVRFGLLKDLPDVNKISDTLLMQDLYREVAKEMKLMVPDDDMKPIAIQLDSVTFDPNDPAAYLKTAALKKSS